MSGYSGTPLAKKLGIKDGYSVYFKNPPSDYDALLQPLPTHLKVVSQLTPELDFIHFFTKQRSELERELERQLTMIKQDGMIWVSWPKKASKVATDITEDVVREVALPMGLVDVKVCAVDDIWSGLKLVIRKENRK